MSGEKIGLLLIWFRESGKASTFFSVLRKNLKSQDKKGLRFAEYS